MKFFYLVKAEEYETMKKSCDSKIGEEDLEKNNKKQIISSEHIPDEVKINLLSQKKDKFEEEANNIEKKEEESVSDMDIVSIVNTLPEKYRENAKSLLLHLLNHIKISKYGFVKHEKFAHSLRIEDLLRSILVNRAKINNGVEEFIGLVPIDEKYILNQKLITGGSGRVWELF